MSIATEDYLKNKQNSLKHIQSKVSLKWTNLRNLRNLEKRIQIIKSKRCKSELNHDKTQNSMLTLRKRWFQI